MKLSRLLTGELALVSLCGLVATGQTPLPAATTHHLRYRFVDLGTFGGPGSVFPEFQTVVNNFGSAVGGADLEASNPNPECFNPIYVPDCNIQHAFLVRAGHLADLGTIRGGANSFAFAINQFGSIAGVSETSNVDLVSGFSEFHAVLWRNGHPKDLGTLGGTSSLAVWVNDWGLAVGSAQNDVADQFSFMGLGTQTHGFISTGETMRDLGTLGGPDTFAQYVNNRGQVAGVSYTSDAADPATGVP
jgi:probable HAF family extracellular repeat protein